MTIYSIKILDFLHKKDFKNKKKSALKLEIKNEIDKTEFRCGSTFNKELWNLKDAGLIAEGYKDRSKKRYYITNEGIDILNS